MTVTATAALVKAFTGDPARPANNMGWNNTSGDPDWLGSLSQAGDLDWYRRVQLTCSGDAGENVNIVNWEILGDVVPVRTTAEINALADGATGALINNKTTWTVWAYTGTDVAGQAYRDTKTPCVASLRANGRAVQVVLGSGKKAESWTVGAFLPGAGRVPTAQAAITTTPPARVTGVTLPATVSVVKGGTTASISAAVAPANAQNKTVIWTSSNTAVAAVAQSTVSQAAGIITSGANAGTCTVTATTVDGGFTASCAVTVTDVVLREAPTSASTKQEVLDWLAEQGVDITDPVVVHLSKKELLELVQDVLDDEEEQTDGQ